MDKHFTQWVQQTFPGCVTLDEPMSRHTSFRVGGPADVFVSPRATEDAVSIINTARKASVPVTVIGDGTNLIVKDDGIRGVVMVLSDIAVDIVHTPLDDTRVQLTVHAGMKTHRVCRYAMEHGFSGMNFAVGIPGTIGGNIAMNAGTQAGAMDKVVASVEVLNGSGTVKAIPRNRLNFSYRTLRWPKTSGNDDYAPIILTADLVLHYGDPATVTEEANRLLVARKESQPVSKPNAGCIFKNPAGGEPAGKLIDMAGLKGTQIGGAQISERHANFIINTGSATATDILDLVSLAVDTVHDRFGIVLEPEVKIVGD